MVLRFIAYPSAYLFSCIAPTLLTVSSFPLLLPIFSRLTSPLSRSILDCCLAVDGFAQVYPEHKYLIVECLREMGYKVCSHYYFNPLFHSLSYFFSNSLVKKKSHTYSYTPSHSYILITFHSLSQTKSHSHSDTLITFYFLSLLLFTLPLTPTL
jgi:hypothetical protein